MRRLPVRYRLFCRLPPQRREPEVGSSQPDYCVNLPRVTDLLVGLQCGDCARPAAVDREMRQKSRGFARLQSIRKGSSQVVAKGSRLSSRDQYGEGHEAAIAWRQLGTIPHVTEQHVVGEGRQPGRDPLLEVS